MLKTPFYLGFLCDSRSHISNHYKLCKDNYITANINSLINFQNKKDGSKCISNLLHVYSPSASPTSILNI